MHNMHQYVCYLPWTKNVQRLISGGVLVLWIFPPCCGPLRNMQIYQCLISPNPFRNAPATPGRLHGGRKMPGRSLFWGGPFAMAPATPLGPSHDPAIMRLNQDVNEPVFCAPRSFEEEVSNGRFGTQVGSGSISLPCQAYWKRWKWKSHLWKACSSIKVDSCRQPHRLV